MRLPAELKQTIAREAAINGRTLHAEIVWRLTNSASEMKAAGLLREPGAVEAAELPDTERSLLSLFRRLGPEKQLALLTLLNGK